MLDEFKKFALRGNVVDLAVGVIIGGAFGKIVTSLVSDIIMPVLGVITGRINLTALKWTISEGKEGAEALSINYGQFLQSMLDFILVAFSIFMIVKLINNIRKKEEEKPTLPPKPSNEELVLTEIRDILKSQNK